MAILKRIRLLSRERYYTYGRSFTSTFMATSEFKRNDGMCYVTPDHLHVIDSQALVNAFLGLYNSVASKEIESMGYGRILCVWKNFAIDYVSWYGKPEYMSLGLTEQENEDEPAFDHSRDFNRTLFDITTDPDWENCWPFRSNMIGGAEAALGSYIVRVGTLVSPNGRYKVIMQQDCNFVLYEAYLENVNAVVWESDTFRKAKGCYINLQMDGNLVLVDSSGKQVLFASNRYCPNQPNCVVTAGLSVTDNGYIVIWQTDTQTELWREPK
ncbi:hypothetical protein SELMODRAFT_420647 [Selaginella moellendorffii]|uniref:Bulb-type lectin domain-containing protein n=1 Tax=Selaginella moellendorffii TaxID=88036 RepID=D8SCN7_SELML|nr:hypothetical protein SELMODRAFT_420647 [Selaginella moellendorffii]